MAGSLEEQIAELEAELVKTPYNKATSKHIGRIKAKMAKLRDEAGLPCDEVRRGRGRLLRQEVRRCDRSPRRVPVDR